MKTKLIFCANCQEEKDHGLSLAPNGEVVATCDCGRFLKFPATLGAKEINKLVETHKDKNEGQVRVEQQEKLLSEVSD